MKNRIFKWLVHHCQKIICVVLFLSCVITVYYGHIKDRMYQKIINTIKSENELIADTNSGIWSFARRDNLEFLLDNTQSNRLLQLNAINLSSFVVMQYTDSYSFCLCWVTFIHQITSIKLSIDNEGDSVTIEIPDMVQKQHLAESQSFICHGYADIVEKNNKLYNFLKKMNDGERIYVVFLCGEKKVGELAEKRVRIVKFSESPSGANIHTRFE